MNITLKLYKNSDKKIWDNFISYSCNGTIFHLRDFLSYHKERKFYDNSLIFYKNKSIIALFSAAKLYQNNKKILFSHPGASFGGFVYNKLSYKDIKEIIYLIEKYCIKKSFNKLIFIMTPMIYSNHFNETLEYLFIWNKYKIEEHYISSILKINSNNLFNINFNKRKKRYIKNYLNNKNFKISIENNFDIFYPILVSNKKNHKVNPTHSLEELKYLYRKFPEKIHLLLLYYKEQVIGGALNIIANNNCGILFYNMIDYKYKKLQAASIQVFESIKWAQKNHLKYLDLGVSHQPKLKNPLTPHEKLINFKEKFGTNAVIRKKIVKDFNV